MINLLFRFNFGLKQLYSEADRSKLDFHGRKYILEIKLDYKEEYLESETGNFKNNDYSIFDVERIIVNEALPFITYKSFKGIFNLLKGESLKLLAEHISETLRVHFCGAIKLNNFKIKEYNALADKEKLCVEYILD